MSMVSLMPLCPKHKSGPPGLCRIRSPPHPDLSSAPRHHWICAPLASFLCANPSQHLCLLSQIISSFHPLHATPRAILDQCFPLHTRLGLQGISLVPCLVTSTPLLHQFHLLLALKTPQCWFSMHLLSKNSLLFFIKFGEGGREGHWDQGHSKWVSSVSVGLWYCL